MSFWQHTCCGRFPAMFFRLMACADGKVLCLLLMDLLGGLLHVLQRHICLMCAHFAAGKYLNVGLFAGRL